MYIDTIQELSETAYTLIKKPNKFMCEEEFGRRCAALWAIDEMLQRCWDNPDKDPEEVIFVFSVELSALELMASKPVPKRYFREAYKAVKEILSYIEEEM